MSSSTTDSTSQIEAFSKPKKVYLKNFQEYLSNVPEQASTFAKLSLDEKEPSEVHHIYKDYLGCRLDYHQPPQEDFDAEEEHLKTLVEKFSNKLPYLNDWLADFQERRTKAEANMPSNKEDETTGHLTDQVAKESSDSTASDHHTHNVDTGAKEGKDTGHMKATAQDHSATPGIVMTNDELPEKKSKEENKARAAELNK